MSLGTQLAETRRRQRGDEQTGLFVRRLYGLFGWFGFLRCSVGIPCPGGGFVPEVAWACVWLLDDAGVAFLRIMSMRCCSVPTGKLPVGVVPSDVAASFEAVARARFAFAW